MYAQKNNKNEIKNQKDSLENLKTEDLEQVVITATRSEKLLSEIPIPMTIIDKEQIQQMGSLRLSDVLQEQTGLTLIQEHGEGIQMQGFDPDYTLILIDGEPLIGRTAGTLELSRIAVGNIERIEIIKGASSSLYGSEALAGVINIITKNPNGTEGSISARYGTNQTSDLGISFQTKKDKLAITAFANRYGSNGYDFTPNSFGKTVEPFDNYTFQSKIAYKFNDKISLSVSGRYFEENQIGRFDLGTEENPNKVSGDGKVTDYNILSNLDWRITQKWRTYFRLYYSKYKTDSKLNYENDNSVYDESFFDQIFIRPEFQSVYSFNEKNFLTAGIGSVNESVSSTRYTDKKYLQTNYIFAQHEFFINKKSNITLGARFDSHSVYGNQLSPKIASYYQISPKIRLTASAGMGFKTPDFRQLYLNFTNNVVGYSVFGTEEILQGVSDLQEAGQIAEVLLNPNDIKEIKAETSISYNIGIKYNATKKLILKANFFRNDVDNLIETQIVARKTNGQNLFSYTNLNSIFTQGIETELNYSILNSANSTLTFSAGYQYLEAKDKTVLDEIEDGNYFARDPETLETKRLTKADYGGLMGRSNHMTNAKLFYKNSKNGFSANVRAIYRSKYGFGDRNGNLILDQANEYVDGYTTVNISAGKQLLNQKLNLQIGADNLLNYKNESYIPTLAGRLLWVRMEFSIQKK
ncbi:TonB-dependent receptor plug domain-containing protein [Bernardetia litoralis]|uniref:TonB-dependent receptor plug domain-containing protein n=1 Tax=Bernardetia litoralis TaxID=999 RepID=UPI0002DB623D|nr:TonB-dependent receptor [Bernardetia litoralis]